MNSVRTLKSTASVRRQIAIASSVAVATAAVAGMTLPATFFQASAIVAVDEPSAALRLAAARSAADLAVSKPVVIRAAASLNGTAVTAPAPALAEKLGVATGLLGATGAVARLAEALAPTLVAHAGDGLVEIQARATDGARAAQVATALGEALIAEEEGSILADAHRREMAAAVRLETLREAARAAHARLLALGATDGDPVEMLAAAGTATRAAETRLAAVHAVIAAGTPPLGGGSELPQSAAALQQTYWDLKKQLDKASESMGERHTTVIALRDGVSRATAALTGEWQRIERAAASDVAVTRSREAVLRKSISVADPARRAAVEEARGVARLADAAVARAAVPVSAAFVAPPLRLVAPAAVPAAPAGLGPWQRGAISGGSGIGAFALAWLATRRRRSRPVEATYRDETSISPGTGAAETSADLAFVTLPKEAMSPEASARSDEQLATDDSLVQLAVEQPSPFDVAETPAIAYSDDRGQPDYDYRASDQPEYHSEPFADERSVAMPYESASFDTEPDPSAEPRPSQPTSRTLDPDLRDALRAIAADLEGLASGRMASVMVAANSAGADTGAVALALGEAAAELGYRVLVLENDRDRSTLAEAVAPDGAPLLVDAFGALRVALPAERLGGLFLAPALRDGARIAAALARNTQAELVDDLAAAFDAVVIDGGRAADSAAAGWNADAFIRVGRFASHKDDAHLLATFDAPEETLLGTIAAGRFVAREVPVPVTRVIGRPALRSVSASPDVPSPRRSVAAPSSPLRAPVRRRLAR